MAIILRTIKGTSLTYEEMDRNLSQFSYSGSISKATNQHTLYLHYTGSSGLGYIPRSESIDITPFPFRGTAQITGSLNVTGSIYYNGTLIDELFGSGSTASGSASVSGGLGINILTQASESIINLNTGSAHFQDGVYRFGIFRETGSFWNTTNNVGITGSLVITPSSNQDSLSFDVLGSTQFKVNSQGIMVLTSQSVAPIAVAGGMYFDNDNSYYLGFY
jgi:hypothetical protein